MKTSPLDIQKRAACEQASGLVEALFDLDSRSCQHLSYLYSSIEMRQEFLAIASAECRLNFRIFLTSEVSGKAGSWESNEITHALVAIDGWLKAFADYKEYVAIVFLYDKSLAVSSESEETSQERLDSASEKCRLIFTAYRDRKDSSETDPAKSHNFQYCLKSMDNWLKIFAEYEKSVANYNQASVYSNWVNDLLSQVHDIEEELCVNV